MEGRIGVGGGCRRAQLSGLGDGLLWGTRGEGCEQEKGQQGLHLQTEIGRIRGEKMARIGFGKRPPFPFATPPCIKLIYLLYLFT